MGKHELTRVNMSEHLYAYIGKQGYTWVMHLLFSFSLELIDQNVTALLKFLLSVTLVCYFCYCIVEKFSKLTV